MFSYYNKTLGEKVKDEIQYLLENDIRENGEYQLTNVNDHCYEIINILFETVLPKNSQCLRTVK